MSGIRVKVVRTRGSVPRDAGTSMMVFADRTSGTIGGGALEWDAIRTARAMLAEGHKTAERVVPLGPALGQCCGGSVTLKFAKADEQALPRAPLWIWGAGHVGRALVQVLHPLERFEITWIDMEAACFPEIPDGISRLVATEMARVAPRAPQGARHIIVTRSHDVDLALCHALLGRAGPIGLIGSETKWARFQRRLRALGHSDAEIGGIRCPIGQKSLGKHPQAIAVGVAAEILTETPQVERKAG